MVRESYLKNGPASRATRGDENEKWVRVSWDKALELAAKAIRDTYDNYGPSAVTVPHTAGCQPGSSTPLFRVSIVF